MKGGQDSCRWIWLCCLMVKNTLFIFNALVILHGGQELGYLEAKENRLRGTEI